MRNAFSDALIKVARENASLVLLVGDIGFRVFDDFREEFPERFYNVGIAEANMIGVAAGLAMSGMRPVVYTIIPFLVMRTFEQIRVDLCIQDLPVTLVGVGGGLAYDTLGPTHHAIEDLSIMRSLPNMQILTPCDPQEVLLSFKEGFYSDTPTYIRLGKGGEENILTDENLNKRIVNTPTLIKSGEDVLFISYGPILKDVNEAANSISMDYNCAIMNVHMFKPLDSNYLICFLKKFKYVITVEEHTIMGGLGSAIAEIIAINGIKSKLNIIGISDKITKEVGKRDYLLKQHKMDSENIAKRVKLFLTTDGKNY
jgi:transketolase